jgi:hypothetical protein
MLCVAASMAWCAPPLRAVQTPSTEPCGGVADLIDRFGSDDFATRQAAQKALTDMGDSVEPQLRGLLSGDLDDEARARINGVLHAIEERILLGPSVITLHFKNAPLQTILEDFARQARADLGVHRPRIVEYALNRRATIDLDHASFWDALDAIGNASGLRPAPFTGESAMVLDVAGNTSNIFANKLHQSGAFALIAMPGRWNRGAMRAHGMQTGINLIVVAEPKLHVLGPVKNDWLKECLDNKGQAMSTNSFFSGGPWWWQLNTVVHSAGDAGTKIALFGGEIKFTVQTRCDVFEVEDLNKLKDLTRFVNQTAVTLKQFTNHNGKYELEMVFAGAAQLNQWEWNRIQSVVSTIQILDDEDQPLQYRGPTSIRAGENLDLTIEYVATEPRDSSIFHTVGPRKLRWEVATETRTVSVPFELRDLDLP